MKGVLPEVSEADGEGEIAALYADIRLTLGIPFVGLIYRTLAVKPGRLSEAWNQLRPLLNHLETRIAAAALDPGIDGAPEVVPARGLPAAGFDRRFAARAAATLAAYDHMNRLNLLGLTALLEPQRPAASTGPAGPAPAPAPRWTRDDLLGMPDLDALVEADRKLLLEISQSLLPGPGPVLVPSLLRHFALPGLLPALWQSIRSAIEGGFVPIASAGLRRQAAALPLPAGVRIDPPSDRGITEAAQRFVVATSTMVVTGGLLGRALSPLLGGAARDLH